MVLTEIQQPKGMFPCVLSYAAAFSSSLLNVICKKRRVEQFHGYANFYPSRGSCFFLRRRSWLKLRFLLNICFFVSFV